MKATKEKTSYCVVLLDRDGSSISNREADTLRDAKRIARYMLSDEWARSGETTHQALGTGKVEILKDGECVWDDFLSCCSEWSDDVLEV